MFVNSGICYDMVVAYKAHGQEYFDQIVAENVSRQIKLVPEHVSIMSSG